MKRLSILLLSALMISSSCKKEEADPPAPVKPSLTLKSISPTAGSTLNGTEMMTAVLEYNIGDDYNATELYEVSLMIKSTTGGWTFGGNDPNDVELTAKSGTVTIQYDFGDLWSQSYYMHPFTIHFDMSYREGNAPPYTWAILAYSEEVVYAN